MLGQLFADRRGPANVRLEGRHSFGRRRRRRAQDAIQDPHAAGDRRGSGAVGRHLQHAGHRQDAAAVAVPRQRHLAKLPTLHAGDAVVLRQPAVEHREVGGDEVGQAQVVLQDFVEEQFRLPDHRHLQHVVELGVEDVAGLRGVDVAQAEPLADEVLGEGRRLRMLEQALDLLAERVRLAQLLLLGQAEQFLVGHRAPEEVGEPAGQREVVELARFLAQEQEVRRNQHAPGGRRGSLARTSTSRPASS